MNPKPCCGVRLFYRYLGAEQLCQARILIVRADDPDAAIERAGHLARDNYESDTTTHQHPIVCAGVA